MALFLPRGVLRGFAPAACEETGYGVHHVRLTINPCAALRGTIIAHFWIGHLIGSVTLRGWTLIVLLNLKQRNSVASACPVGPEDRTGVRDQYKTL